MRYDRSGGDEMTSENPIYEQPIVVATFEAADLLGDAHGLANGSGLDPSEHVNLGVATRPLL
jgi:hypothetical protein